MSNKKPKWAKDKPTKTKPTFANVQTKAKQKKVETVNVDLLVKQLATVYSVTIDEQGLFDETILASGWDGWRAMGPLTSAPYLRKVAYFDDMIAANKYKSIQAAEDDARSVVKLFDDFLLAGTDGDLLDNTFIRLYGVDEKEFKAEELESLHEILVKCWKVGNATSVYNVKKSLYSSASSGNLDATKTVLTATGDLEVGSQKTGGDMYFLIDAEDQNA